MLEDLLQRRPYNAVTDLIDGQVALHLRGSASGGGAGLPIVIDPTQLGTNGLPIALDPAIRSAVWR